MLSVRPAHCAGWAGGLAERHDLPAEPELDANGNHADRFIVALGEHTIRLVVPSLPDDSEPSVQ